MTDPLITHYLPVLNGYIVNRYAWMETRGNCLVTVQDLQQIAAIALVKLVRRWDNLVAQEYPTEPHRRDDGDPRFWRLLEKVVKNDVSRYLKQEGNLSAQEHMNTSFDDAAEADAENEATKRTAIHPKEPKPHWPIVSRAVIEHFQLMPRVDKTLIALRYYDELPVAEIAALFNEKRPTISQRENRAITRWRAHARNQYTDHREDVPARGPAPWDPPVTLIEYIETRHRTDLPGYLWKVTESFRVDVGYITRIIGPTKFEAPNIRPTAISPYIGKQIDTMHEDGESEPEISRVLGIGRMAVRGHLSRRRAA